MASYKGRPLGSIGDLGCYSFHETKNLISGEGGALLVNNPELVQRAEIIREKGTNRSQFFRGELDKYTWVDIGSSFLPGELIAAFLCGQLEDAIWITETRLQIWSIYHEAFATLEKSGRLRRPVLPKACVHNGHMYYLILRDLEDRSGFITAMQEQGVHCVFHYVPLHVCEQARVIRKTSVGSLSNTLQVSDSLVRLPLWVGLHHDQERILEAACKYLT
jgi:dTDP-4-amino-4,6-dideoxygalactose transaminase